MYDACRRLMGWLFFLLLVGISHGQGPATTVVSDVVFRADGTRAAGTLLISWPSFITANGEAVAGGNQERDVRCAGCAFCRARSKYRRHSGQCSVHCDFSFG